MSELDKLDLTMNVTVELFKNVMSYERFLFC